MIGTRIHQYTITDKLGAGGMGEVFLAEDTRLGRNVALKFLPERFSSDPEFKSRFEHEARAAAALNHPNIITVHDLGEHEGRLYIAMEHVPGRTLAELIDADEISIRKALELGIQICDGLGAAHNAGIIHRDIKPANILVDDAGRARILDFGLAKSRRATTDTRAGSTLGTVQYESPEQSRGEKVDHRSDLFSFGSVLYEMVTGKLAFPGDYEEAVRYAIAQETVEPLARYKKDVPPQLEDVVAKLLEKEPEMRYQTAGGVISDLKRIQRDLTQTTPPAARKTPEPDSGPSSGAVMGARARRPARKLVIPAIVVVILLALVLVFKPWRFQVAPTQDAHAVENRLAIMYFDNLSDPEDPRRQGEIITDLLITDLTASPELQVVSSQRLYDILKLLGREGEKRLGRDVASQVAEKANARWMLTGSILRTAPNAVLTAQLVELASGNVLTSTRIDGTQGEDLFSLVSRVSADIRSRLDMSPPPADAGLELKGMPAATAEAYRHYLEGVELLHKYKQKEAGVAFERAIELDSTFAMAYYGLSFVYPVDNKRDAAIRRAVTLSDRVGPKERLYILARHAENIERFLDSADLEKTEALYTEIIEKYPDEKEAYYRLGSLYENWTRRDRAKAIEMYRKALELDPLDKRAYNELAYAYREVGDLEKSIWAINKYVELVPDEANAYDSRADLYAMNGNLEKAIEDYQKALDVDPEFVGSLQKLAYARLFAGDIAGAEAVMRQRASHADATVRSGGRGGLKNISLYLGKLGEARERMQHFLTSRRIESSSGESDWRQQHQLGEFFIDLWHISGDDAWLDSALALKPFVDSAWHADTTSNKLMPYHRRVDFHAYIGDFATADSLLSQPYDTTIGWANLFYWRASSITAFSKGEYDTAAYYAERWVEHSPLFVTLAAQGCAYLHAGRTSEAVMTLEKAAKTYDHSRVFAAEFVVNVFYWLGRAYEESGWNDRAIEQYEKVCEIWKDADPGIAHHEDARARLTRLQARP